MAFQFGDYLEVTLDSMLGRAVFNCIYLKSSCIVTDKPLPENIMTSINRKWSDECIFREFQTDVQKVVNVHLIERPDVMKDKDYDYYDYFQINGGLATLCTDGEFGGLYLDDGRDVDFHEEAFRKMKENTINYKTYQMHIKNIDPLIERHNRTEATLAKMPRHTEIQGWIFTELSCGLQNGFNYEDIDNIEWVEDRFEFYNKGFCYAKLTPDYENDGFNLDFFYPSTNNIEMLTPSKSGKKYWYSYRIVNRFDTEGEIFLVKSYRLSENPEESIKKVFEPND